MSGPLSGFIQALPKTETHLHLEGALPYELLHKWQPAKYPASPAFRTPGYRFETFSKFDAIAARRGVTVERTKRHEVRAVACAPWLQDRIAAGIAAVGAEPLRLPSGAGHDAMILAEATDVGMMFVRCGAGGVSHNPAETVSAEDVALAVRALLEFLRRFEPPRR